MALSDVQTIDEEEEDAQPPAARRPVDTARVGNVEIAVWRNRGSNGEFFTASAPTIRYKDDKGEWKEGSSYGPLDLLMLAEAAREASAKIRELSKSQTRGR